MDREIAKHRMVLRRTSRGIQIVRKTDGEKQSPENDPLKTLLGITAVSTLGAGVANVRKTARPSFGSEKQPFFFSFYSLLCPLVCVFL